MLLLEAQTVGALLKEVEVRAWESQHLVTGAPTRRPRRPGTAAYYGQCIARVVETWPSLINARADVITPDHCAQWFTRFRKMFCPEASNGALIVLRAAFAVAVRRGYAPADPTADLQRALIPDRSWTLPDGAQWQRALEAMHAYASARPPHRHTVRQVWLARWLVATAMRPAAACALLVGDVDLVAATVRLDGEHAKNGRTVTLPISKEAVEIARTAGAGRDPYENLFRTTSARGVLRAASAAVGVKINHCTLRRMFATKAIAAGVPPPIAAKLLTQSDDGRILQKHYMQWSDQILRAAITKMESPPPLMKTLLVLTLILSISTASAQRNALSPSDRMWFEMESDRQRFLQQSDNWFQQRDHIRAENRAAAGYFLGSIFGALINSAAQQQAVNANNAIAAEIRQQNELLRQQIAEQQRQARLAAMTPEQRAAEAAREYREQLGCWAFAKELQAKNFCPELSQTQRNKVISEYGFNPGFLVQPAPPSGVYPTPGELVTLFHGARCCYINLLASKQVEKNISQYARAKRIRALGFDPATLKPLEDSGSSLAGR